MKTLKHKTYNYIQFLDETTKAQRSKTNCLMFSEPVTAKMKTWMQFFWQIQISAPHHATDVAVCLLCQRLKCTVCASSPADVPRPQYSEAVTPLVHSVAVPNINYFNFLKTAKPQIYIRPTKKQTSFLHELIYATFL